MTKLNDNLYFLAKTFNIPVKEIELSPLPNQQKSFRGKAKISIDVDGNETLYSYNTAIIRRKKSGELVRIWGGWSATTGKHIKAFCGLNKAGFIALPVANR